MTIANSIAARFARLRRRRGGLVTLATVAALVTAMGLTVLGLGAADQAVASFDAASWAWSRGKGEVARINGVTAKVDTRVDVPQGRGHQMQISQTDRFVVMRDLETGQVSSMDLTSLQIAATTQTTAGLGVSVALHEDSAFVVDAVQGVVSQLDPRTLTPLGEPIRFLPGITGGVFDGKGRLWIAAPAEGTVTAITAAPLPSQDSSADPDADAAATPRKVRTIPVAPPSHDLDLSSLDTGVAVLNRTTNALTTIRGDEQKTVPLRLAGPGALPPRTDGAVVPVTVPDDRHVYVVGADGVHDFEVPGKGTRLRPAVAWQGFIYCADEQSGTVHVFDGQGNPEPDITVKNAGGPVELEVRENHLFINAPDSPTARVVDDRHAVRSVDKYADEVLGGDPPPAPEQPAPETKSNASTQDPNTPKAKSRPAAKPKSKPKPKEKPKPKPKAPAPKPVAKKPGPPEAVRAEAGNAQARVTWRPAQANGAAIARYVVEGADRTLQVGADQRSVQVEGLVNGQAYRFTVYAVNAKGAGPERASNEVRPTAEVPDAPTGVTAEARADGSVAVRWQAANGQGLSIKRYAVTALKDGGGAPIGESEGTELVIAPGELEYGRQYAFSVVAVNERGAGSKPSEPSGTVIPFTKPGPPTGLSATTVGAEKGTIRVVWGPAQANGRPVQKYLVWAGAQLQEVTATRTTVSRLGDDKNVSVKVSAVNEAGEGPSVSTSAKTVAKPTIRVTGGSATVNTARVTFAVNPGGGTAQCSAWGGGTETMQRCTGATFTGLKPSTRYTFTIKAENAAGSKTVNTVVTTGDVIGIATCKNGQDGDTKHYCDEERPGRNGNEIFAGVTQSRDQVGWAKPGTPLKALCQKNGEDVDSYIYNNHKRSKVWIRVAYKGKNYIPWAWLNLRGGDNLGILPKC